jgi:hypothetical protein
MPPAPQHALTFQKRRKPRHQTVAFPQEKPLPSLWGAEASGVKAGTAMAEGHLALGPLAQRPSLPTLRNVEIRHRQ